MDTEFLLRYVVASGVASVIGALVSLAFIALKVLPGKVSRKDVQEMIETQPLQFQYQALLERVNQGHVTMVSIREEIVGLRSDVVRLTTTLELVLRGRV